MQHKILVLFALTGLLVSAVAGLRPDSAIRADKLARRHLGLDSGRILHARDRRAALPVATGANRAIQSASHAPKPGPPRPLGEGPFTGHTEYEVAPEAPAGGQYVPAVAFDGTNYLVVWHDGSGDIYGALVTSTGEPVDPAKDGLLISDYTSKYTPWCPAVAFDGTNYLVVWTDAPNPPHNNWDICGALVSTEGAVLDDPGVFFITPSWTANQYQPSVAFDGTNYLVVFQDDHRDGSADIYGVRVSTVGEVVHGDENGIAIAAEDGVQEFPSVAFDGTHYLVVWDDAVDGNVCIHGALVSPADAIPTDLGALSSSTSSEYFSSVAFDGTRYLVVWQDRRNYDTYNYEVQEGYDIYGTLVTTEGDPVGDFPISQADYDQSNPSVAFDGTNYLVAWVDRYDGIYAYIINGCRIDPDGDPVDEFTISTTDPVDAWQVPRAACGGGTVLVAYAGDINSDYVMRVLARAGTVDEVADIRADIIFRPAASYLMPSWPIMPLVKVTNIGPAATTPFTVRLTATPGTYSSTKTVPALAAGRECEVMFNALTLTPGVFTARLSTWLAGDPNPRNNVLAASFQGCTFIDYADYADSGFTLGGNWEQGPPLSPWTLPHMDAQAWGDRLSGYYGDNENSYLTSPAYKADLAGPAIAFQHNFDTNLHVDGGNFEYTTDNGSSWEPRTPYAGLDYNGAVSALGASGWSGNSSGWKQSVFTIPVAKDDPFMVRWHFDSEGSNSTYHGWLIDEVAGINCHRLVDGWPPQPSGRAIDTVKVWPNMVRGAAQVNYTLFRDCNVTINLYDATGRLAARVPTSGFKKGKNTARLDASGLARGVYFVKVKGETDTRTTKVIIE